MESNIRIVSPGAGNTLRDEYGNSVVPPNGWAFLPSGDAGITRKVKAGGEYWKVEFKKGRYTMSKGLWAPAACIRAAQTAVSAVRSTETYTRRLERDRTTRHKKEETYRSLFLLEVKIFLDFDIRYKEFEEKMAQMITDHATPVGSGTVARTTTIPVEKRAERAVIAWMRHKTTAYDSMKIPFVKGARREIRQQLAEKSRALLRSYRQGSTIDEHCPLEKALRCGIR